MDSTALRYTVTRPDLLAMAAYHFDHTPQLARRAYLVTGCIWFTTILFVVLAAYAFGIPMLFAAAGALVLYAGATLRRDARRFTLREYERLLDESEVIALGHHEIRLEGFRLHSHANGRCASFHLDSLKRVDVTTEYTFVYVDDLTGFPIPREGVVAGCYEGFVDQLMRQTYASGDGSNGQAERAPDHAGLPRNGTALQRSAREAGA